MDLKEPNKWTLNDRKRILVYFRRGGNGCIVIYSVRSCGDTLPEAVCHSS